MKLWFQIKIFCIFVLLKHSQLSSNLFNGSLHRSNNVNWWYFYFTIFFSIIYFNSIKCNSSFIIIGFIIFDNGIQFIFKWSSMLFIKKRKTTIKALSRIKFHHLLLRIGLYFTFQINLTKKLVVLRELIDIQVVKIERKLSFMVQIVEQATLMCNWS